MQQWDSQDEVGASGLESAKKNREMESLASTFGSEEGCANPLLGLTHLRELGEDYPWSV